MKGRLLTRGLGILWLVAGLLQAQPNMFTSDFYAWYPDSIMASLLQGVADGQPAWLAQTIHFGSRLWGQSPVIANVLSIVIQCGIGLLLLWGKSRASRLVLWVSVFWGVIVWLFGEGLGGVLSGGSYFDGVPGSVILMVILAIALLVSSRTATSRGLANCLRYVLVIYWLYVTILQALPGNGFWNGNALFSQFANIAALPQPALLSYPIQVFAELCLQHPFSCNIVILLFMTVLVIATLLDMRSPLYLLFSMLWLGWSWWFGQGFGAMFSGLATDVNSMPLIALMTLAGVRLAREKVAEATPFRGGQPAA